LALSVDDATEETGRISLTFADFSAADSIHAHEIPARLAWGCASVGECRRSPMSGRITAAVREPACRSVVRAPRPGDSRPALHDAAVPQRHAKTGSGMARHRWSVDVEPEPRPALRHR